MEPADDSVLVAIDIGATKIAVTVLDGSSPQFAVRRSTRAVLRFAEDPQTGMAKLIRDACRERGVALECVGCVVVGVPGVLDRESGRVASCPNLPELDGLELGMDLSRRLGVRVIVENDVNLVALGEQSVGRGRGVEDLACVLVGSGIGCGLVLGGALYAGPAGAAGELGHTVIEASGRPCTCGAQGCLEMYCSGKALAAWAAGAGLEPVDGSDERDEYHGAETLIRAAEAGDRRARAALDESFAYLGVGVVNLVNLLNPRLVLLGGGLLTGWPSGLEQVKAIVSKRARIVARGAVEIARPALGDGAFAIGAARLASTRVTPQGEVNRWPQ